MRKIFLLFAICSIVITGCGQAGYKELSQDDEIISYEELIDNWAMYRGVRVSVVLKAKYVYGDDSTKKILSEKSNGLDFFVYFNKTLYIHEDDYIVITGDVSDGIILEIENAVLNYSEEKAEHIYVEKVEEYEKKVAEAELEKEAKEAEEKAQLQLEQEELINSEIDSMTKEEYIGKCWFYHYSQLEEQSIGTKVMLDVVDALGGKYVDADLVVPEVGYQHLYTCYSFSYEYLREANTEATDELSIAPVYRVYGFLGYKSAEHMGSGHRDLVVYPVYMEYLGDISDYQNGKLDCNYVESSDVSFGDMSREEFMKMCTPIANGVGISGCDDTLQCYEVCLVKKQKLTNSDAGKKLARLDDSDFTYSQIVWKAYVEGKYKDHAINSYLTLYFANEGDALPDNYYEGQKIYVYTINYEKRTVVVYVK